MDKLNMNTRNKANENFEKLRQLFPSAVTEAKNENGEIVRSIDKDVLMQEINSYVIEGNEERYQFTWPDKKKAINLANSPINKTLRPCREESVNFDNTENVYIEGDNLEVLKILQESYLGKIKIIYIDPPYNTGNDFVYKDRYTMSLEEYEEINGDYDEEGNRLYVNRETNGRFHTDWLNMIYPRLKIARDLLSDDGVIFISIDDNEQENLKKICDEIFGECNFISQIIWERAYAPVNLKKHFSIAHDYVICYAKDINLAICNGFKRDEEANSRYSNPDNDPRGMWQSDNFSVGPAVENNIYKIITPSGRECLPPNGKSWRVSESKFKEMLEDNRVWFGSDGNGVPRQKRFLSEVKNNLTPMSIWKYSEVGHSQEATKKLKDLFDNTYVFDYSKTVDLIKKCVELYSDQNCIVLDFFSGSATAAHAVMQLNAEDGGKRKFIMVQLPEKISENSEAYKAGYKNICEIGKERIRRAGKKIIEENKEKEGIEKLDVGFRVFKCDSSNMKDVYYNPDEFEISLLDGFIENIKEDRTPEDLLFQVMLNFAIELSSDIREEIICGKKVFNVKGNYLVACFDNDINEEVIEVVAKQKPQYFVIKDRSIKDDNMAINFEQIFSTYSPNTVRKVL